MIRLYNSLSKKKEDFVPLQKNQVKIYSCGPTVYSFQHIGNMRAAIFIDTLKRLFRYFNYNVIDVVNITDVGHLVSDEDEGEDKMLKAAKRENKNPYEIAKFYEEKYLEDLKKLNVISPRFMPRATEHIKEQIKTIQELEKNGLTYTTSDGVYYDVSKFKNYGKLSGQSLEQKKAGARVDVNSEKRNPQDFALWKFLTGDNKNHVMKWDSPWGTGFPGWHLECSAMSYKYLGNEFDIHTGGIEHRGVHHENEIAQNEGSGQINKINYWMHNDHLLVNSEKMSKSLGNVYLISDLEKKGYDPLAFRELCLRSHYRKNVNFTFESLKAGQANVESYNEFYNKLKNLKEATEAQDTLKLENNYLDKFEEALKDDLNTAEALSAVHEFMSKVNKMKLLSYNDIQVAIKFIERVDKILGLLRIAQEVPNEVTDLAHKRLEARNEKNWTKADELRDKIKNLGYEVKDSKNSKEGFILNKI